MKGNEAVNSTAAGVARIPRCLLMCVVSAIMLIWKHYYLVLCIIWTLLTDFLQTILNYFADHLFDRSRRNSIRSFLGLGGATYQKIHFCQMEKPEIGMHEYLTSSLVTTAYIHAVVFAFQFFADAFECHLHKASDNPSFAGGWNEIIMGHIPSTLSSRFT